MLVAFFSLSSYSYLGNGGTDRPHHVIHNTNVLASVALCIL